MIWLCGWLWWAVTQAAAVAKVVGAVVWAGRLLGAAVCLCVGEAGNRGEDGR